MNGTTNPAEFSQSCVPPKLTEPRDRRLPAFALVILAAAGVAAVLFFFNPSQHRFYPICYFHAITGLDCPGCGGLRAMHQLLHGHFVEAARLNALLILSLAYLGWLSARFVAARLRGQSASFAIRPAWLWTFLCVAAVFTVLRNLPAFAWLAP